MLLLTEKGPIREAFVKALTGLWEFGPERVLTPEALERRYLSHPGTFHQGALGEARNGPLQIHQERLHGQAP
eukprot:9469858-Pyramimonas_sp.AAC.1